MMANKRCVVTSFPLFIILGLLLLQTCLSAPPKNARNNSGTPKDPDSLSVVSVDSETKAQQQPVRASVLDYSEVELPFDCATDSTLFKFCYFCAVMAKDRTLYNGCCERKEATLQDCTRVVGEKPAPAPSAGTTKKRKFFRKSVLHK